MKTTKEYLETTIDAMIEDALAELEASGEVLPEIRYGEKVEG